MNRLQHTTSPYLLQHANNPVDWYPWSEEAFDKAKGQNKPVLVSIGYAACHWCHVMEHESFEDQSVAAYMNDHFINIKVDREEHPDVDHFYMDALQAMSGAGGWPLNMFVTPDRKPFYGGTYFPPKRMYARASWLEVLQAVHTSWIEKKEEVESQAEQMTRYLENATLSSQKDVITLDKQLTEKMAQYLIHQADKENGGFSAAPKFPATMAIQYLLDYAHFHKNNEALSIAILSLDKMIDGGIYDQIGGGFSRYATDNNWLVPHFEKMLYDNALLINVLSTAFILTKNPKYKTVIEDTIEFCNRELGDQNKLWYAALDADSEGVEGKFYTWTHQEIIALLPDLHPALKAYWGIQENGNWEETNILHVAQAENIILESYGIKKDEWQEILTIAKQKLFTERAKRERPQTDIKVLLSWNALMITALIQAGKALQQPQYITLAEQAINAIIALFTQKDKKGLYHVYTQGNPNIDATLEDYAYFIKALLSIYEETAKKQYLTEAVLWLHYVNDNFSDKNSIYYYYSAQNQKSIPVRKIDKYDGATPSANAIMVYNLWTIGNLTYDFNHIERAETMLQQMSGSTLRYATSFAQWAIYMQYYVEGWEQLMIISRQKNKMEIHKMYLPQIFSVIYKDKNQLPKHLQYLDTNEEDVYLLCQKGSCSMPRKNLSEIFLNKK